MESFSILLVTMLKIDKKSWCAFENSPYTHRITPVLNSAADDLANYHGQLGGIACQYAAKLQQICGRCRNAKAGLAHSNLAEVYAVYHDWGNAIQAQILQIEGEAAPDDYDRLSRWWLRRQYDIALQQRYFQEHTLAM